MPFEEFFWTLKRVFPGDPDFGVGTYGDLSYGYVLSAVNNGIKNHQRNLHERELPIAQQSAILANNNRDVKKKRDPYNVYDFTLFRPKEDEDLPSSVYGSAAMTMIKKGIFPSWALFCYKQLSSIADSDYDPPFYALMAEDAILLHPVMAPNGYSGMLIAREAAGGKKLNFTRPNGDTLLLEVPPVYTKVIAEEGVTLLL